MLARASDQLTLKHILLCVCPSSVCVHFCSQVLPAGSLGVCVRACTLCLNKVTFRNVDTCLHTCQVRLVLDCVFRCVYNLWSALRCVCLYVLSHGGQPLMWCCGSMSRHTAGPGGNASSSFRNALPFSCGTELIQAHLDP